jgi:hypothetical protein
MIVRRRLGGPKPQDRHKKAPISDRLQLAVMPSSLRRGRLRALSGVTDPRSRELI